MEGITLYKRFHLQAVTTASPPYPSEDPVIPSAIQFGWNPRIHIKLTFTFKMI